jgi:hypothetical protein
LNERFAVAREHVHLREHDLGTILLVTSGLLGVIASCVHGYLGETRIIARSSFPSRQAKELVRAIWQFSTAIWIVCALVFVAAPWTFDDASRPWIVAAACLPILWGIVGNAWITRGCHPGWAIFALITLLAMFGAVGV